MFSDFFSHPLICGLIRQGAARVAEEASGKLTGERRPSYIPSKTFTAALFDIIAPEDKDAPAAHIGGISPKIDRARWRFSGNPALMTRRLRPRPCTHPADAGLDLKIRLVEILDANRNGDTEALRKVLDPTATTRCGPNSMPYFCRHRWG
jgi:hypothetical protein